MDTKIRFRHLITGEEGKVDEDTFVKMKERYPIAKIVDESDPKQTKTVPSSAAKKLAEDAARDAANL